MTSSTKEQGGHFDEAKMDKIRFYVPRRVIDMAFRLYIKDLMVWQICTILI